MTNFASKFWHWLADRSPKNAATPVVQPRSTHDAPGLSIPQGSETIEVNVETECMGGLRSEVGSVESFLKGPGGELVRANRKVALIVGCQHTVTQLQAVDQPDRHIRGIAGPCSLCASQYQQQLLRGEITAFDADRLSLVCTDCGKITTSGLLCCPKHYVAVANPDGTTTYLGPEEFEQQKRQNTIKMILGPIASLFVETGQDTSRTGQQEHDNEQKTD